MLNFKERKEKNVKGCAVSEPRSGPRWMSDLLSMTSEPSSGSHLHIS